MLNLSCVVNLQIVGQVDIREAFYLIEVVPLVAARRLHLIVFKDALRVAKVELLFVRVMLRNFIFQLNLSFDFLPLASLTVGIVVNKILVCDIDRFEFHQVVTALFTAKVHIVINYDRDDVLERWLPLVLLCLGLVSSVDVIYLRPC